MTMKDLHGLECPRCKIQAEFYENFNSDSKKNISYFGVLSYVDQYVVMPVSSDQPKEEIPKNGVSYRSSNVCYLQLLNEWTIRELIAKEIKGENRLLSSHIKEKKRKLPRPSFYLPEHTGNLIKLKSESFSDASLNNIVCSDDIEIPKDVYKCKLTKKSPPKQKVAHKEPKVGTLKRKRYNWEKLKQKESYEDDLFEEKKFQRVVLEDSNPSEEDKIVTPQWSVQISPREQSRSPSYEDCYSPTELQSIRKEAEEYQYRRNKRKKYMPVPKKGDDSADMKKDPETYKTLEEVRKKLKKLEKTDCESEEDYYFTDGEDSND